MELATLREEKVSFPMTSEGNGKFVGQLSLLLEDYYKVLLEALIFYKRL